MKLFAPKNNWDMASPTGWWPLMGTVQTSSGVAVSEDSALMLTAFACGVRVISETIASLPCSLLRQKDARTTEKAIDHGLYSLIHDEPNPEQDSMLFFDAQIAWQVGWGNSFTEIERSGGKIVALWPIHPCRIPIQNIRRNGDDLDEIYAGEPGEIVYWVNNDDNTKTPIPASDMLHVTGPLSRNGITGRSLVQLGKSAIGIAVATEDHAGAFFKNGASPNIAITHPKALGKEAADRLRLQWQQMFAGAKNAYKTLILEEGMSASPFTISPEASQLIVSRQYGVTEVSRLLRIPPHMLMDLTRATFSNIEAQSLDLITYCLLPWIVRWERAMKRQLLTDAEKKKYRFQFNVMGLLRGDQAARGEFYTKLFNMGALSPNDILEKEDMNPVEGGDQRFVPANNLVPLDLVAELAEATIEKMKAPPPAPPPPAKPAEPASDPRDPNEGKADAIMRLAERIYDLQVANAMRGDNSASKEDVRASIDATSKLPDEFSAKLQPLIEAVVEQRTETVEMFKAMADEQRSERQASEARAKALIDSSILSTHEIAAGFGKYVADIPKSMEEAQKPLVTAINTHSEAISAQNGKILDAITAVPGQIVIQQPVVPPVDTSAAEALAVREADLERKRSEHDAKLVDDLVAFRDVLQSAIQIVVNDLADWESKSVALGAETPSGFIKWRVDFYRRYVVRFCDRLAHIAPQAERIGVQLDLQDSAEKYATASISDLRTLDEFAQDNWHDRLKSGVDTIRKNLWAGRAEAVAKEMIEQGKQRFEGKNHAA